MKQGRAIFILMGFTEKRLRGTRGRTEEKKRPSGTSREKVDVLFRGRKIQPGRENNGEEGT